MELFDVDLVPGVIYNVSDPLKMGRVKASAPGLFNATDMHDEAIPWLYPWGMPGYQRFSKLEIGTKIWIFSNKDNLHEYWYIPMYEYINEAKTFLEENYDKSPEIFVFRNNGSHVVSFTYDDLEGFKESINKSYIQLKPSDEIDINADEVRIQLAGNKITIGNKNTKYEQAVLGNTLLDILTKLRAEFSSCSTLAQSNPFTCQLAPGFTKCEKSLATIEQILADNTKVN